MPVPERSPYRWVMFAGVAAVYYAFGFMVTGMAPLVSTIRADLGISRGAMGAALGAWAFIYIFTAPPAGRVIDRLGLRSGIAIGMVFVAVSGVLRAAANGLGTMWLAIALFGIGGPLVSAGAPKVMAVWFEDADERRFAIGAYSAAPALGGFSALALTNSVLLPWLGTWRRVMVFNASLSVVALLVWLVIASRAPMSPSPERNAKSPLLKSWAALVKQPGVRLALWLGLGAFFVNHALSSWLPNILEEDGGFSKSASSSWVAASVLVGVLVTLTVPRMATAERRPMVLGSTLAAMCVGMLLLALWPATLGPVGIFVLAVRAALVPLIIVVLLESEGVNAANSGEANGLWFSVAEVGGVSGPLAAGLLGDSSLGFSGGLFLFVGVCILLGVLVQFRQELLVGADSRM